MTLRSRLGVAEKCKTLEEEVGPENGVGREVSSRIVRGTVKRGEVRKCRPEQVGSQTRWSNGSPEWRTFYGSLCEMVKRGQEGAARPGTLGVRRTTK